MLIVVVYVLAAVATTAGVIAGAIRTAMKWRERRRYGPGAPVYDLTGRRVTWARRTGAVHQDGQRVVARLMRGGVRIGRKP